MEEAVEKALYVPMYIGHGVLYKITYKLKSMIKK